jgi:CspA family cold shock protein
MKGIVKWYNIKQGYGFIEGDDRKDAFIHKSNLPFWTIYLKTGDKVRYKPKKSTKGWEATELDYLD